MSATDGTTTRGAAVHAFLIGDIRAYSTFTREQGDERAAALSRVFAQLASAAVDDEGGSVLGLRGDEIAASFVSPRAAVRAAVNMQRRFAEYVRDDPSLPLRVGIGLDVGEAVAVEDGFRGQALNLAARLCAKARAGEVLISEALQHLVGRMEDLPMRDAGRMRLKGFDQPIHVYRLVFDLDLPAPRRSRRRWSIVLGAVVAVAAVGAGILHTVASSRSSTRLPVASSLVTGVYRVDPTTDKLVAVIGSGDREPVNGIAYGFGSLWMSGGHGLLRINPNTNHVGAHIPITGGSYDVATTAERVWVSGGIDAVVLGSNVANVIDPRPNGDFPTQVPLQPFNSQANAPWLVSYDDNVWTWTNGLDDCCVGRQLWKIDGRSHSVLAKLPTADKVAAGREGVWEIRNGQVYQIDPNTNRVHPPVPDLAGAQEIAVGAGEVWVSGAAPLGQITKIDPKSNSVITNFTVPANIGGIAAGSGGVWVSDMEHNRLLRIDPASTHLTATIPLGDRPPGRIALGPGAVWIVFGEPARQQ